MSANECYHFPLIAGFHQVRITKLSLSYQKLEI